MNKETLITIRKNIMNELPDNTVTFLFSGLPVRKSADAEYPFFANRNFFYGTHIEEPGAILVFDKPNQKEILFLRDIDEFKEKWIGHYMRDTEAFERCGVADIRYFSAFDDYVGEVIKAGYKIGVDMDHDTIADEYYGSGLMFSEEFDENFVTDIFENIVKCRMVKLPEEVEAIKAAAEVTNTAIMSMVEEMKPGNNENDMTARFLYEGNRAHGDLMFDTIVASGKNATTLHYISNDQPLNDGELVLLDLGIRVNGYGADISRTFPINGKYTQRQREVYQEVLNCFHAINEAIKPGVSILDLNELSKELLGKSCIKLGLINSVEEVGQYYYHSIGHSLGLDTHDVWLDRATPLVVGNVITNEPGLYIVEENIGIRIETDVVVTENGCEDLAPQIIREVDAIEKTMLK
ncbi:MAG: Xaa-Pro aminopeptidase [Erysipelothrix sp.]